MRRVWKCLTCYWPEMLYVLLLVALLLPMVVVIVCRWWSFLLGSIK